MSGDVPGATRAAQGSAGDDEGWSTPSLHSGRGRGVEPRTYTEADPISAMLVADWAGARAEPVWSETTYVGRRRYRPDGRRRSAAAAPAPPPADTRAFEAPERREAGPAPAAEQADRGLLANSRSMALASLVSRVTGFLRSSMLVAAIGIGPVGDAYNLGNNLPNMVYELLLGGVLSSVLIPLLVHAQESDRRRRGRLHPATAVARHRGARRDDPRRGGLRTAARRRVRPTRAQRSLTGVFATPAAARDLLLRPRRDVHGGAEHP